MHLKLKAVCANCGKTLTINLAKDFPDDCDVLLKVAEHSCQNDDPMSDDYEDLSCDELIEGR